MITLHLDDAVIKSLSNNELNVLKFVYGHPEEVLNMSIQELAKQISYSSSTILRFCKKLGYSGYAELKYALRAELRKEPASAVSHEKSDFTIRMMLNQLCSNVENTSRLITEDQLARTFRYFDSSCRIYLWAPGGITSILTDYFEKLLFSIGRQNVYKFDSQKAGKHLLQNSQTDSILILISTSGEHDPTIRLAKLAVMNNVPIISITPYTNNTIADMATVSFRFFTYQRENMGVEFTSRLPIFFMISMIIRSYLQYKQSAEQKPYFKVSSAKQVSEADQVSDTDEKSQIPLFEKAHALSLTDTEKEILAYFENSLPSAVYANLSELSNALYTSNATIIRFCQKLGLKGYNEFKYQVRNELEQLHTSLLVSNDLIPHSVALFKDNIESFNIEKLDAIADLLISDRQVYIYGSYLSSLPARYLQTILNTLDYPSILIEWQRLLNGLSYGINNNTVLFIITAHGDAQRYLPVFLTAAEQNACTILLTCEKDSPLIPYSTVYLCTNDQNQIYHHEDINPRIGIITIVQIIIELIVQKKRSESTQMKAVKPKVTEEKITEEPV